MADYSSLHFPKYEGEKTKAEKLLNNWFTFNGVKEFAPTLHNAMLGKKYTNQIAGLEEEYRKAIGVVLTVHAPVHVSEPSKQVG